MSLRVAKLLLLLLLLVVAGDAVWAQSELLVQTQSGILTGKYTSSAQKSIQFLGVPFAQSPVGSLRFMPPQPLFDPNTPKDATAFGNSCVQQDNKQFVGSEDCLMLNIYKPSMTHRQGQSSPMAVMVWIFGGGFAGGSPNLYDGSFMVENEPNIIVVTINYRLNIFGFLALQSAAQASSSGVSGNLGIEDQRMALRWVRNNIAAFGGDPDRVTVFGQSAGGISSCVHVLSPLSAGLIQGAIFESGPCVGLSNSLSYGYNQGSNFVAKTTCASLTGQDQLSCLQNLPTDTLMTVAQANGFLDFLGPNALLPIVDGYNVPDLPLKLLQQGRFNKVPILLGTNLNEWRYFVLPNPEFNSLNNQQYEALAKKLTKGIQPLVDYYTVSRFGSTALALSALETDLVERCPVRIVARYVSLWGPNVYLYLWSHAITAVTWTTIPDLGVYHGAELPFIFGTPTGFGSSFTPQEQLLSQWSQQFWVRFATGQDPNSYSSGGYPPLIWPPYKLDSQQNLNFSLNPYVISNLDEEICNMWEPYFGLTSTSYKLPSYLTASSQRVSTSSSNTPLIVGGLGLGFALLGLILLVTLFLISYRKKKSSFPNTYSSSRTDNPASTVYRPMGTDGSL